MPWAAVTAVQDEGDGAACVLTPEQPPGSGPGHRRCPASQVHQQPGDHRAWWGHHEYTQQRVPGGDPPRKTLPCQLLQGQPWTQGEPAPLTQRVRQAPRPLRLPTPAPLPAVPVTRQVDKKHVVEPGCLCEEHFMVQYEQHL